MVAAIAHVHPGTVPWRTCLAPSWFGSSFLSTLLRSANEMSALAAYRAMSIRSPDVCLRSMPAMVRRGEARALFQLLCESQHASPDA